MVSVAGRFFVELPGVSAPPGPFCWGGETPLLASRSVDDCDIVRERLFGLPLPTAPLLSASIIHRRRKSQVASKEMLAGDAGESGEVVVVVE